jgi:KDO2-lipid IV(A) lauroyltransferase
MTAVAEADLGALLGPRHWPSWAGLGLLRLLGFLPLPLLWLLGGALGEALYRLHATRRRIALINLGRCFPQYSERARRRLARAHFRALLRAAVMLPVAWWGGRRRLARLTREQGRAHFDAARAAGAVILLAPHFVAMDIAGLVLNSQGVPGVSIYRRTNNPVVNYYLGRRRARFGGTMIERAQGLRPVVRAMRAGRVLYYLPDQDPGRQNSVFAPFLEVAAATLTAASGLARLSGAAVVPCFSRLLPWGRGFEIRFLPPLAPFPTDDAVADAARINAAIEQGVRWMPEQYLWTHKRFKTRPEGEPDFYS